MSEKELYRLLDKMEQGTSSEEERQLLYRLYQKFQHTNTMEPWADSKVEASKKRLWNRINGSIGKPQKPGTQKVVWKRVVVAAAMMVGISLLGLFVLRTMAPGPVTKGQITLELPDGTVKVLDSEKSQPIHDHNGNKIGNQLGNQVVFSPSVAIDKKALHTVHVPYGKKVAISLPDGTKINLNAGSSLTFPASFTKGNKRQVSLTGEAYLKVAKDTLHPFILKANELSVEVLGTEFNVHAYSEDQFSEVVLVEGSVQLASAGKESRPSSTLLLLPGNKARFQHSSQRLSQEPVSTEIYTAWLEDELVFRDMSFDNILKKLERQYDVDIINQNRQLSTVKFQASFGKKPLIETVFEELSLVYHINYKIKGNTITIH
ncbi:iron dicitrate transport regulator FecR [Echinicola strongylocentroti]|uniref:Iron dicitrate transport regulator FecR n=1 Tax=Echinicola strongylocentroti TaxID=1795355 RepID=A0A2Z4ICV4_9BACT|nr:FecR family protein [Echinicola strongylocentroti]AWW28831.1 iron dicitrate transport regulator FecR [Echinicola strongylocentroti]